MTDSEQRAIERYALPFLARSLTYFLPRTQDARSVLPLEDQPPPLSTLIQSATSLNDLLPQTEERLVLEESC